MAKVINRPIIDRDITAFPCTFAPNKDTLRVYFYFQSMQEEGVNINTDYVVANITVGGSNQAINGFQYEPFKVWKDNEDLVLDDRYYIEISSALMKADSVDLKKCFTINTVIDVQIKALSNNLGADFFHILQNRIWHRDWNGKNNEITKALMNTQTAGIVMCSEWSSQVSFHAIAEPTFTTWGGLTESQVAESNSLSDDAKQIYVLDEYSSTQNHKFDASENYIFKCELDFKSHKDADKSVYYEDDQLETYDVKLYGLASNSDSMTIGGTGATGYATLVELESTNGKAYLDTRWDKTKRMFRHTLKYNFLQGAFKAYQLTITYYTAQGYKATHSYIITPNTGTVEDKTNHEYFTLKEISVRPIEEKGVIHITAKLCDKRIESVQELGVFVVERAEDINVGLPEDSDKRGRLKWYSCYESNHRAKCETPSTGPTVTSQPVDHIEYDDASAEPGVFYKYRVRFKVWKDNTWQYATHQGEEGIETYIETPDPTILFVEDIFLATRDLTLKIRYNPDLTTYKRNVVDAITPTLGGAYPFVRRNGAQIYRTFNIGGLISYNSEVYEPNRWVLNDNYQPIDINESEGEFFRSLFINKAGKNSIDTTRYNNLVNQGIITSEQKRVLYERLFREMVMDFLYDDHVMLFKSQPEGNIFVRLSNVSLTPDKQLDRHIYSFTATATEVLEANAENYLKYFSPIADGKEDTIQNVYLVAGYYTYNNGTLFIGEFGEGADHNISDPNAEGCIVAPTWDKDGAYDESEEYTTIDLHLVTEAKETEWEG